MRGSRVKRATPYGRRDTGAYRAEPARRQARRPLGPLHLGIRQAAPTAGSISLQRQVRALVASKRRDAADVDRSTTITLTNLSCLTSSTNYSTAASSTGLLDMDGDECLINSVRLKGGFTIVAALLENQISVSDCMVRIIVVWYNKPLLIASAAGTIPPITEVLVADNMVSLPVTAAANGGRFVILSDRTWNMGMNLHQSATAGGYVRDSGRHRQVFDYTVKVDKRIKFVAPSASGASTSGGHYDSDVPAGRVDRGLLCMYVMHAGSQGPAMTLTTRLNYTG